MTCCEDYAALLGVTVDIVVASVAFDLSFPVVSRLQQNMDFSSALNSLLIVM